MAQERNKNTYSFTNHGRSLSISNKNEVINNVSLTQKNYHFTKENYSSVVNISKSKQEVNKKKTIVIKSKLKNVNTNFNNGSELGCSYNKSLSHLKKDNNDNNNIKSFQNQNTNSHKYSQKSNTNNLNINNSVGSLTLEPNHTVQNCTSVSADSSNIAVSNFIEEKNNLFPNAGQVQTTNRVIYHQFLSKQPALSFTPNQCCQQVNSENWNSSNIRFSQQGKNVKHNESFSNTSNVSPLLTKNYSLANFKQQNILKNTFSIHKKGVSNGYLNKDVNFPSLSVSNNQHNNRVKVHQNYHNLTYVVTEKENSCISDEKKKSKSIDLPNLTAGNDYSTNLTVSHVSLTKSKTMDMETSSVKNCDFLEVAPSKNVLLSAGCGPDSQSSSTCVKNTLEPLIHSKPQYSTVAQILPNFQEPTALENMHKIQNYNFLQQNFAYFDPKANSNMINIYSPYRLPHQPEPSTIYTNDNLKLLNSPKRSQKKHTNGKKPWYSTLKTFHTPGNTPPDRFLAKSYLMEIKLNPKHLLKNSEWDKISFEIWQKFSIYQQKEITYRKKIYLWKYLYLSIKRNFPRYGLYLVGSTITGFGIDNSDVDMCLVHRASFSLDSRFEAISHLNNIQEYLKTLEIFEQFHLIEAKVPILRFCDSNNSIEVDLNFNNSVGIRNTHLLYCYSQLDWRLRPLALTVKLWARYHNINNAKTMTISSYSLVLMVIHFLQFGVSPPVLPCLHEMYPEKFNIILTTNEFGFVDMIEEIKPYKSENTKTLGELFLLFLEYYANFNYAKYAISIRTGKLLPIEECRNVQSVKNDIHQWRELCIEEPFDLTNTARSVYDYETFDKIKNIFLMSWQILKNTMELNNIFAPLYFFQETKVQKIK